MLTNVQTLLILSVNNFVPITMVATHVPVKVDTGTWEDNVLVSHLII